MQNLFGGVEMLKEILLFFTIILRLRNMNLKVCQILKKECFQRRILKKLSLKCVYPRIHSSFDPDLGYLKKC